MRRLYAAATAVALGGCAALPPPAAPPQGWAFEGRIALNRGEDGVSGQLDWRHDAARDELRLRSPLGQTVARIVRDPAGVTLETGEATHHAADAESRTQASLGASLPLSGLAWWVRGQPDPARPHRADPPAGPPTRLWQDGWTIDYRDRFADGLPRKLDARRDDLHLRLLVERWAE